MSSIYLVNIGANASHSGRARSPIVTDGSFIYVSFPTEDSNESEYSADARPFLYEAGSVLRTHADPDWKGL